MLQGGDVEVVLEFHNGRIIRKIYNAQDQGRLKGIEEEMEQIGRNIMDPNYKPFEYTK